MAQYVAPVRGGARCPLCGAMAPTWRTMPVESGCRVRYHKCECGWTGKTVEKVVVMVVGYVVKDEG